MELYNRTAQEIIVCYLFTSPKQKKAFTLLEIIVAMGLMSTALLAIFTVVQMSLSARLHSQKLTQAVLLAQNQLTQILLNDHLAYEKTQGNHGLFDWETMIAETNIEALATLTVNVNWNEKNRPQRYTLTTLRKLKTYDQSQ